MVIPKLPSYKKVEGDWHENGGISPKRVIDSIGKSVMNRAYQVYPNLLKKEREILERDYETAEFFAFDLALMHLDRWGQMATIEPVIIFSDVSSGMFNAWVQSHYDFMLAIGEEPNGTPLQEARWLGEELVKRLVANEFIKEGPSYYELEEKGRQYAKAVREKNHDLMHQLYGNWQPLNRILDNRIHNR